MPIRCCASTSCGPDLRAFVAVPAAARSPICGVPVRTPSGMHTAYGRQMPVHCAVYLDAAADRRLSCLRLEQARDAEQPDRIAVRFGKDSRDPARPPLQRLLCTCAPVNDYTGREVARVGVFQHAAAERPFVGDATALRQRSSREADFRAPGLRSQRRRGGEDFIQRRSVSGVHHLLSRASGPKTVHASTSVRSTVFTRAKTNRSLRRSRCSTSIPTSASTAAPAFPRVRWRPSSRSTKHRRSGRTSFPMNAEYYQK